MAKRLLKKKAIELRKKGLSYSQIKEKIEVSKSTLSLWLKEYPLSDERVRELRDNSLKRIEKYIKTRQRQKDQRLEEVFTKAKREIGVLSERDLLIAGLFLYWGEGYKTGDTRTAMGNTNPAILRCFIEWLYLLGAKKSRIRVKLTLYADMDDREEKEYWSKKLGLSMDQFWKSYYKKSKIKEIKYFKQYTHGTCNVFYLDRDINDRVLMSLRYLNEKIY